MRCSCLLLVLFFSNSFFSQSPGGVGTGNLRGWFDASTGVTLTGGVVSAWTDRAGVGNATQGTNGERPSVTSAFFNYNDVLTFDGASDNLDLADRMASTVTAVSIYAVARQVATSGDPWGSIFNGQVSGPAWTGGGYGLVSLNAGSTSHGFYIQDYNSKGVSFAVTNSVTYLYGGNWNGTTSNAVELFRNGVTSGTIAYTPGQVGDGGSSWIGAGNGAGPDYCYNGNIAEIAVFNTGLSVANNNRVHSYLALKYGITMGTSYANSAGTTVYATSGTYTNNIIGISRDDGSGLIQKQSKNVDDTVRIYLSTLAASNSANGGSFAANLSHVVVGADNASMRSSNATTNEIPSGYGLYSRLGREWKVTNTNFGGTFSMDFKLNATAVGSVTASQLRLLLDDDGNFAAGTRSVIPTGSLGITITYANPIITVSGISTSLIASGATSFITIGSASPATPLPVNLLEFYAKSKEDHTELFWSTASEKSNDHFEVERSSDAFNFEKILSVNSKAPGGNNSGRLDYFAEDFTAQEGLSYYRLKQVDHNGVFSHSGIVSVDRNLPVSKEVIVFPNPGNGDFSIEVNGFSGGTNAVLELRNSFGALVYSVPFIVSGTKMYLNVSLAENLAEGIYFCTVRCGESIYTSKLMIGDY